MKHRRRTGLIFSQWGDPQRGPHLAPCCHCPSSRSPLCEHPLNVGVSAAGSQFLNNGLTSGDSLAGRSPLQGGSQESGSWHAHLPSAQPHSPTAPGQDWASGSVPGASQQAWQHLPARGCLGGGREGALLKAPGKYSGAFQTRIRGAGRAPASVAGAVFGVSQGSEGSASSRVLDHHPGFPLIPTGSHCE